MISIAAAEQRTTALSELPAPRKEGAGKRRGRSPYPIRLPPSQREALSNAETRSST